MIITKTISFMSHNPAPKLMDITPRVERVVSASKITDGQVLVFASHTTCAVILQEREPGLHQDLRQLICRIAPQEASYQHSLSPDHLIDKMPNGHSHCQHLLLGCSEVVPVAGGKMLLGQFQRIFLVELDRSRMRNVVVQVTGE